MAALEMKRKTERDGGRKRERDGGREGGGEGGGKREVSLIPV